MILGFRGSVLLFACWNPVLNQPQWQDWKQTSLAEGRALPCLGNTSSGHVLHLIHCHWIWSDLHDCRYLRNASSWKKVSTEVIWIMDWSSILVTKASIFIWMCPLFKVWSEYIGNLNMWPVQYSNGKRVSGVNSWYLNDILVTYLNVNRTPVRTY